MADDPHTQQTGAPTDGKDPLAVLEELLAKQKQGGPAGDSGTAVAGAAVPAAPTQPDPAQIQAERQAEYERIKAETAARDAELIAEQAAKMEALKETPQYQARVAQDVAADAKKTEEQSEQVGYEIDQITTQRVPVPSDQVTT